MDNQITDCEIHSNAQMIETTHHNNGEYLTYYSCLECIKDSIKYGLKMISEAEKYNRAIVILEKKLGDDGLEALFEILTNENGLNYKK